MKHADSLRRGAEFQRAWESGRAWSHPLLILRVSANGTAKNRYGFVVGKKVGKAVQRNRAKRLMREAIRHRQETLSKGWDIILIARSRADQAEFKEIDAALGELLERARMVAK
jgi:ribonuclease P protein component